MKNIGKNEGEETSWGGVSSWYSNYLDHDNDSYHKKVILPNLERLWNIKEDNNFLDLACGEGFFARRAFELGAKVIGVDISKELLSLAKEKSHAKIAFVDSPSHDLSMLRDSHFDIASITLAIQNIEKVKETFSEVYRVLQDKGRFYIVLNHPSFRIPKFSSWNFNEDTKTQSRDVSAYMSEKKIEIDMNPGGKEKNVTYSFHRPLQYYFKLISNSGFVVTRLEEWVSHKKSEKGKRQIAEDIARKEIPMFLMIEARAEK